MVTTTVSPSPLDDWLDEKDAAPEIGLQPSTLTAYRKKRRGLVLSRRRPQVQVSPANLHAWMAAWGTCSTEEGPNVVLSVVPAPPVVIASPPVEATKPVKRRTMAGAR